MDSVEIDERFVGSNKYRSKSIIGLVSSCRLKSRHELIKFLYNKIMELDYRLGTELKFFSKKIFATLVKIT